MVIQTHIVSRWVEPERLLAILDEVRDEVNTFLRTLNVNDVLDVRYETGESVPYQSDRQARMFHLATVIYVDRSLP